MRCSEKNFSKRNCTHHQRHRRRHPVPFLILTCVRQPQRLQHRLPSRNHKERLSIAQNVAAAVTGGRSENPAAEDSGSYNAAPLRKNANLGGSTESRPTDSSCAKISLVGRRSAEPQKDNFPIYPQRPQNSSVGGSTFNTASAGSRYHLLYRRILAVGRNCFSHRCEPPFASVRW